MLFEIAFCLLIVLWSGYLFVAVAREEKRIPGRYLLQFLGACALLVWAVF